MIGINNWSFLKKYIVEKLYMYLPQIILQMSLRRKGFTFGQFYNMVGEVNLLLPCGLPIWDACNLLIIISCTSTYTSVYKYTQRHIHTQSISITDNRAFERHALRPCAADSPGIHLMTQSLKQPTLSKYTCRS